MDALGSVYKFTTDCGAQLADMLKKMEKLPFHKDEESLTYNENFVEIKNNQTYSFEGAAADAVFLRTVPPTEPYAHIPYVSRRCMLVWRLLCTKAALFSDYRHVPL